MVDFGESRSHTMRPSYTSVVQECQPVGVHTRGLYDRPHGVPSNFRFKYGISIVCIELQDKVSIDYAEAIANEVGHKAILFANEKDDEFIVHNLISKIISAKGKTMIIIYLLRKITFISVSRYITYDVLVLYVEKYRYYK